MVVWWRLEGWHVSRDTPGVSSFAFEYLLTFVNELFQKQIIQTVLSVIASSVARALCVAVRVGMPGCNKWVQTRIVLCVTAGDQTSMWVQTKTDGLAAVMSPSPYLATDRKWTRYATMREQDTGSSAVLLRPAPTHPISSFTTPTSRGPPSSAPQAQTSPTRRRSHLLSHHMSAIARTSITWQGQTTITVLYCTATCMHAT